MRIVTYEEVLKEIDDLGTLIDNTRKQVCKCRYNATHKKLFKWAYEYDYEYYYQKYTRLMYRYKIIQDFRYNFGHFVAGVPYKDYKYTRRLIDYLDRLKLVNAIDNLQVQIDDMTTSFKDLKVRLK